MATGGGRVTLLHILLGWCVLGPGLCVGVRLGTAGGKRKPRLWPWWEQRLASVSGAKAPQRCLAAPRLQTERLGWEGSDRHWDGLDLKTELSILKEVQDFNQQKAKTGTAGKASW